MNELTLKEVLINALGKDNIRDEEIAGIAAVSVPREIFTQAARALKGAGCRLAAEWASDETPFGRGYGVFAVYNKGTEYIAVRIELPLNDPSFPSLTKKFVPAYRFERQIHSLMGLTPVNHPDLRPWIKHEDWPESAYPLRKSFDAKQALDRVQRSYKWVKAEGEGVYEIAVGPVHAGIIEPGHFRFQAVGEDIINLEARLGYVHKGIEKRFEDLPWDQAARLAGRVSGDSTAAHAAAYCSAVEAASGCVAPQRALWLRALMIERERIANHLGDIGAICNDAAFTFLLYQMAILREKVLRTNHRLFGHRLTMDCVVPGGVTVDITAEGIGEILSEVRYIADEFERLISIYEDNPSLEDRVYGTGTLKPGDAKEICVVGYVARSSGQKLDARLQYPIPPYNKIVPIVPLLSSGDVHARAWVRIEEVRESIRLITEILNSLPAGPVKTDFAPPAPGKSGFSAVEGWRGEIIYWVEAGPDGGINRCMVRDPSSVNWLAIELAIKDNIVPDFPLCNKSFNQSYSGHDL